jgi:hypothetical protein
MSYEPKSYSQKPFPPLEETAHWIKYNLKNLVEEIKGLRHELVSARISSMPPKPSSVRLETRKEDEIPF